MKKMIKDGMISNIIWIEPTPIEIKNLYFNWPLFSITKENYSIMPLAC